MTRPRILSLPDRLDAHPSFSGRGVTMAFVDSGFFAHPDLMRPERRVRAFIDVTRESPIAKEFFAPHARAWHGTMTVCCAAGNGYTSGGAFRGLASEASVVLVRAGSDDGKLRGRDVAAALRVPLRHPELGVRIVNASIGVASDDPDSDDVEVAVAELVGAGVAVFCAAGNRAGLPPEAPGAASDAITVGGEDDGNTADTRDDAPWPSSYGITRSGASKPDLLAPAMLLPAPMLPGTLLAREAPALFALLAVLEEQADEDAYLAGSGAPVDARDRDHTLALARAVEARIAHRKYIATGHQHVDGTSFASPIVASVAAQMLEAAPHLSPARLREGILATAEPIASVPRTVQGAGILRARRAVEWAIASGKGARE